MAPLGVANFTKVNNQYSKVIFVVFYHFCFIANLTTSWGVKLFSKCIILQSKTRGYKPNPVLCEKSPKILGRKQKKTVLDYSEILRLQLGRAVYRKKHKVSIGIASLEIMGVTSSKVND